MAITETSLTNQALLRMGQSLISDLDGDSVNEKKCEAVFDQVRDEVLVDGPEDGWKFATMTYHGIDDHSATISSIAALVAGSTITVATSASHGLVAGDMVELDGDTGYDGTYDVISVVDASPTFTFVVAATFVATGTGTAHWRSGDYSYRYAVPTSLAVLKASAGGIELPDWVEKGGYVLTNNESDEIDITIVKAITDVTLFPVWFRKVFILSLAIELHYNMTQDLKAIQLLAQELDFAVRKAIAMDERGKYVKEFSSSWQDAGRTQDYIE